MTGTPVFLFGTLRHHALREKVAKARLGTVPATLTDTRCVRAEYGDWPVLVEAPGHRSEGLLVTCDAATLARLDAYEAVFGYRRHPVDVDGPDGTVEAQVWRPGRPEPGSGEDWDIDTWAARWAEITLQAADDILGRLERHSPEQVAGRVDIIRARAHAVVQTRKWRRPGKVGSGHSDGDVTVIDRRHPYSGFFTVEEVTARFRRFDGLPPREVNRAVFCVTDAATVLPYDPVRDRVLMIEQVRFGPLAQGDPSPWLLEPVAGLIDAGETPEETARREAAEEAGLALGELHFVSRYYPTPGGVSQVLYSYLGIADLPDEAARLGGHEAEGEDILGHVVDFGDALDLMAAGDLVNAPLIITMQWLAASRDKLRAAAGVA